MSKTYTITTDNKGKAINIYNRLCNNKEVAECGMYSGGQGKGITVFYRYYR